MLEGITVLSTTLGKVQTASYLLGVLGLIFTIGSLLLMIFFLKQEIHS